MVRRGDMNSTTIIVSYHGTPVVIVQQDNTFTLRTGGYRTATTKSRIRTFSPARVYQKARVWYLTWANAAGEWHTKECTVPFYDGIRVDANGVPVQL